MDIREEHVTDNLGGVFQLWSEEQMMAQMMYSKPFPDRIIVQHTQVNREFNGKGIGKRLFLRMIDFAKAEGLHVVPNCQFTRKMFDKYPEFKTLL